MPAQLDFHYIDELIEVRRQQHGGQRGAPAIIDGYREGQSINRSCVVMLSAQLQGFVEDVFVQASGALLPHLAEEPVQAAFRKSFRRWGNPSADNIRDLFSRLGVADVLEGLRWQKCANKTVRGNLNILNQIRNAIAHGRPDIVIDGQEYPLSLAQVGNYRNFVEAFARRFERHVHGKLPWIEEWPDIVGD